MKIAIIDIIGIPYDGTTVFKQGLGGSESAVTLNALELAKLGFDVTVFNRCNTDHASPGVYDKVTYVPLDRLNEDWQFDVVISSRTVIPFVSVEDYAKIGDSRAMPFLPMDLYDRILAQAKMRILWMHDTFCLGDGLIEQLVISDRITDVFTLSDWHLNYVTNCDHGHKRNYEVLKRKMFITRNGAKQWVSEVNVEAKDKDLFVYNASVTKGMIPLVKHIWPHVKKWIPTAKLKVIGGYYRFSQQDGPDQQERDWRAMANDPKNAELDIEFTGIISQQDIAEILVKANFMIYPAAFPETYGISTLESLLYNTPVITCRFGALEETALAEACYMIDYAIQPNGLFPNINYPEQIEKFVGMVVEAYNNPYLHQQKKYYCNIVKGWSGWDAVALQWKQQIFRQCGHYLSRDEYRQVSLINKRLHKVYGRRFHNTVELENYKAGNEQPIVIVSTFWNCEKYIRQCIESVATQDYGRWQMLLVNDCSTDNTMSVIADTIQSLPQDIQKKIIIIDNIERKGAVHNQIDVFRDCIDQAIIMILDGDDSLVNDNSILSYYNTIYHGDAEFTYGSCWSMVDNIPLIAQPYPEIIKQTKQYRNHKFNWNVPYTHLRTFRKYLLNGIDDSEFKDGDEWYRAGGDIAVFYALLERADPAKVLAIQDVVVNYNDINPLNDYKINGREQTITANKILNAKKNTNSNTNGS
jgi:glycosyltransferase involved in cell wall biosynthesis